MAVVSNKHDFKELALIPILHPILKWENTRPAQPNNEGQEFLRTIPADASNQHANQNNALHNQSECLNLAFSGIKCNLAMQNCDCISGYWLTSVSKNWLFFSWNIKGEV